MNGPTDRSLEYLLNFHKPMFSFGSVQNFPSIRAPIFQDLAPRGALETLCANEIAVATFEIAQYREVKVGIIQAAKRLALAHLLEEVCSFQDFDERSHSWFTNKKTRKMLEAKLRQYGLQPSSIEVRAFEAKLDELERVQQMIADSIARRDRMFRQIEDHRAGLATMVRDTGSDTLA